MKFASFMTKTAAIALLGLSATTADAAVRLELGLAIDGSGSISSSDFALQRNAYASVLADGSVLPRNGTVAIGVYLFSDAVQTVFPMTTITNANIGALIAAINGMIQPAGLTNIAGAITVATDDIFGNGLASDTQLIDVSTDGVNNVGDLPAAQAYALGEGIEAINCLGIGIDADCAAVQAGTDSFSVIAGNFDDFEAALRQKIKAEVVPEPGTWAMMIAGFGLVGGAMRRRRTAVAA
jgi:hypothetical protein